MTEAIDGRAQDAGAMPSWSTPDVQSDQAPTAPDATIRPEKPLARVRQLLRELFEKPAGEDDDAASASER